MKIAISILLVLNILLVSYSINELNAIKDQLKPLKIFFRLYSEQSNDLKRKLSEIKEDKEIKSLSNQEIKDQLANQFEMEKKKKKSEKSKLKIQKRRLKAERNILEKYIDQLDSEE